MHTEATIIPEPRLKSLLKNWNRYESPGTGQILAELFQAGGRTSISEIHKLINSIWNNKKLPQQWKESIIVPVYKHSNRNECSN